MERRRYLRCVAVAGGAVSLAGCAEDGSGGEEPTETEADADTDTPTAEPADTPTETEADADTPTAEPTETPPSDPDQRVAVGDGLSFDPESFEVSVGETVLWEWVGAGHNIKYDDGDVPDGTDWEGTAGGRTDTYGEGHAHWHTFETAGEYSYYCVPHRGSGMVGSFTVTE